MGMSKILRTYWPFARAEIQGRMAYKMAYFFTAAEILLMLLSYFLWRAIFASSGEEILNGFSFPEMVTYIFIGNLTKMCTATAAFHVISQDVMEGSIGAQLIKPINYMAMTLFICIGIIIHDFIATGIPVFAGLFGYNYLTAGVLPDGILILKFFLSFGLSFLLACLIDFCIGLIAFYTNYVFGVWMLKLAVMGFLSGGFIPFGFFPEVFQRIFEFLPFGKLVYTPTMIYLGKISGVALWQEIGLQVMWIVIFFGIANLIWSRAIKRLTVLGG